MRPRPRFRVWAGVATVAALIVAGALLLRAREATFPPRAESQRPELLLLGSLPIVFPERFTLDAQSPPVLAALRTRYRVTPISIADTASLNGHRLLLMAQPRAQPAEVLVQLDAWVRRGGHVLLLADPALEWPSDRPLGDPLRPPFAFADTGLLGHWGLRLDSPENLESQRVKVDGPTIRTAAPGRLAATGRNCRTDEGGFIAHCTVGTGEVTVVADADFLDVARFGKANLRLLLAELSQLEQ